MRLLLTEGEAIKPYDAFMELDMKTHKRPESMTDSKVYDHVVPGVPKSMAVALVAAFSPFIHGRVLLNITEGPVEPPVQTMRFFKGKVVIYAMKDGVFYALHIPLKYGYDKQRVRTIFRAWLRLSCFVLTGEEADRGDVLSTILGAFEEGYV